MISEIEIRLRADIARLQQDMNQARQAVGSSLDKINTAVAKTTGLLGGLAVGTAAVSFGRFIKGAIDATDALNDLSDRTSVAVTDLAALDYTARLTGTTLDGVAGAVNKLSMNIGKDTEKFRALGITAEEPVEAFKQLADIFRSIQDPQQRAAFGAAALGKSWQEVAPTLLAGSAGIDELMKKGKALSGVTEEVAADAGKFNDKIDELTFAVQGFGTRIAADLLPLINKFTDDLTATGDAAENTADDFSPLTETLRALIILGGNISFTFKAVGTEIGVIAAQVGRFAGAVGDFVAFDWSSGMDKIRQAFNIGDEAKADAAKAREAFDTWEKGWDSTAMAAQRATDKAAADIDKFMDQVDTAIAGGAHAAQVAAFAKAEEIAAARKKAAEEAEKAAQKERDAYTGLIGAINEKITANRAELASNSPLTEAAKMRIKLDQELKDGKLVLTKEHEKEVRALLGSMESYEHYAASVKAAADAQAELKKERDAAVKTATAEAEAAERLVSEFGKTKLAIEKATLARLEDQLAQRASLGLTLDEIEQLQELIKIKQRTVAAGDQLEVLEEQKKATEDATKAQQDMWASIDRTAHDTFVSILDGGKGLAERLKDTLKNTFFDWLYQQTLRKWIINIGVAASGGGAAGLAQAATGGGGGSGGDALGMLGSVSGMFGAGGLGGALAAGGGWVTGATTLGGSLTAGTSLLTSGTLAGGLAGAASLVGTVLPIIGGVMAAVTLAKKAFGHGPREVTATGIQGTFGAGGFAGTSFEEWMKKGGWFSSTKRGTDVKALGGEQQQAFVTAFQGIQAATTQYAQVLGLSTDAINGYSKDIKLTLTQNQAENEKLIAELFGSIADEMAAGLVPNLKELSAAGESASATLARVTSNYTALDAVLNAIGTTFGAAGVDSLAARERLIALSGGLQTLSTNVAGFAQNFLTEAERLAPVQAAVTKGLAEMGLAWVDTREEFKAVALGLDLTTEAGAKQFAQLMALQEAFAAVTVAASESTVAASESTDVLNQRAALQKQLDQLYMSELEKEKAEIDATNLALYELLQTRKAEKEAAEAAALAEQETTRIFAEMTVKRIEAEKKAAEEAAAAIAKAAESAAKEAQAQMVAGLRGAVEQSLSFVETLINRQKEAEKAAFDDVMQGISDSMDAVNTRVSRLRDLSSALASARFGQPTAQQAVASRSEATAQISAALAIARSTGVLPTADSLKFALGALSEDASGQFATSEDFQRSQLRAANDINALSKLTDSQLTVEERTLKTLQDQKAAAELAYAAQIRDLDALLETAKQQAQAALSGNEIMSQVPPALMDIGGALQSLDRTIEALQVSQRATDEQPSGGGAAPTTPAVPRPGAGTPANPDMAADMAADAEAINEIYEILLQRAADASGLAFYLQALQKGITLSEIEQDIRNSPEYKALHMLNAAQNTTFAQQTQRGTMAEANTALLAQLETLNTQVAGLQAEMAKTAANTASSASSGAQLAQQFDQVSAGGGALLIEPV